MLHDRNEATLARLEDIYLNPDNYYTSPYVAYTCDYCGVEMYEGDSGHIVEYDIICDDCNDEYKVKAEDAKWVKSTLMLQKERLSKRNFNI